MTTPPLTARPRFARRGSAHPLAIGAILVVLAGAGVLVFMMFSAPASAPEAEAADGNAAEPGGTGEASGGRRGADALEAALGAAEVYLNQGRFAEAKVVLTKTAERWPKDQDTRVLLAQALIGQGEFRDAHDQYEAAIMVGPDRHELRFDAGVVAYQAEMIERSIEHFAAAQTAATHIAKYPLYLGMARLRIGETSTAAADLLRAANLDEDLAEAWGTLGELYLRENKLGVAQQMITRAREAQPDVMRWRLIEARILKRNGDPRAAATMILAADPQDRQSEPALELLGECFGLLGEPAKAAEQYELAIAARPSDPVVYMEAARWHERASDFDRARARARTAQMLGAEGAGAFLEQLAAEDG